MSYVKIGCLSLVGLFAALALVFVIAVLTGLMRLPLMNINREVNQNSQQYVETKRTLLLSLLTDYEATDEEGRRTAITNRICEEATLITSSEHPPSVASFVAREC